MIDRSRIRRAHRRHQRRRAFEVAQSWIAYRLPRGILQVRSNLACGNVSAAQRTNKNYTRRKNRRGITAAIQQAIINKLIGYS